MIQVYLVEHRSEKIEDSLKIIGFFSSLVNAKAIVGYYQKSVLGFCEDPNGFRILSCNLSTVKNSFSSKVFLLISWKQDGESESEIKYEGVYASYICAFLSMLKKMVRSPFCKSTIEVFKVNHPEWKEGFIRKE